MRNSGDAVMRRQHFLDSQHSTGNHHATQYLGTTVICPGRQRISADCARSLVISCGRGFALYLSAALYGMERQCYTMLPHLHLKCHKGHHMQPHHGTFCLPWAYQNQPYIVRTGTGYLHVHQGTCLPSSICPSLAKMYLTP